ncbi:NAD-binding of NADP-dependent 3-hydroxyisobutyrate dehydrogenase [Modicisalibacter muralis]|uniref:NAD-binding of NADP-dependent 3-hydroxyisobutyrate dehydrogenase n=1 Tax=Modicisalibacter muralis TaxID=119000 RepID=A0A1G9KJT7_9GAMM|nr:NAD(P)-dependent oxidoreductase [Halomonas muralis]SDL50070.1 NAD-binding of NADP-dependent 3-hydroxyisobutyrate dehydrogenase [Halomonas muralis]
MNDPKTIGFLGTGIMGAPMAGRLCQAGHRVHAWNRTPDKAQALASLGVAAKQTPKQAVDGADVVIVMLSSGPVCDEVILGPTGILASMKRDSILVVMSSIPVATAKRQAEAAAAQHIRYLDAPVSGGEQGAIDGSLAIMAGGEPSVFEQTSALLGLLGRPVRVGPAGTGQLAKLVNQLIVANTIATVSEAMLLAERGGADPSQVREALLGGFADSTILRAHAPRMIANDFKPGGPAKWQLKDTQTTLSLAKELSLDLPVASLVNGLFEDLVVHGDGELDHSALIRELRRRNGMPL